MSRYNPFYFIGQAFKSLWRNSVMTIASILILASCLVVLGSFALLVADLNLNLGELGLMNEIAIYLDPELDDAQVEEIGKTLESMSNVDTITFISKEEGLEEMRHTSASSCGGKDAYPSHHRGRRSRPSSGKGLSRKSAMRPVVLVVYRCP